MKVLLAITFLCFAVLPGLSAIINSKTVEDLNNCSIKIPNLVRQDKDEGQYYLFSDLKNNKPKDDERVRVTFFLKGTSANIYLNQVINYTSFYRTALYSWGTSFIFYYNPAQVDTAVYMDEHLFNANSYTKFSLVITKGEFVYCSYYIGP